MTTQSDALPRCPSCGHTSIGIETYVTDGFYAFCRSCHACGPYVSKEKAIAAFTNPAHALAASRAEVERLRENLQRESRLACDLRSTQDEIIERCAKAVEEWPEAAARLRRHCGGSQDEYFAVSGEDFGEMRRTLDAVCRQYRALLLESDEATMRRAFGDESFERSVAAAKAVCERAIRAALSTAQQGASP